MVDVPPVSPVVTEHRAYRCCCRCGHVTSGAFPEDVRAPVSYGRRAKAIVAYLLGRQHLPGRRVAEAMTDLFGLEISTGATAEAVDLVVRTTFGFRLPIFGPFAIADIAGLDVYRNGVWLGWSEPPSLVLPRQVGVPPPRPD